MGISKLSFPCRNVFFKQVRKVTPLGAVWIRAPIRCDGSFGRKVTKSREKIL